MTTSSSTLPFPLVAPQDLGDPYPIYRSLRERMPVCRRQMSGTQTSDTWYLFRHADVARALTGAQFLRRAALLPVGSGRDPTLAEIIDNWLVFLDPPEHTRLRALISPHFTPAVVEELRPRIVRIVDQLIGDLAVSSTADLISGFAAPLPILVICELLGIPGSYRGWFREQALALQAANSSRPGPAHDQQIKAAGAAGELRDFFLEEIRQRRRRPTRDIISRLTQAGAGGSANDALTDGQIAATGIHLLTAGHETTTNLIAKSVLALLRDDRALAELQHRPAAVADAVDELLRYDSPVQMVTRWTGEPVTFGEQRLPPGSKLILMLGSANRDPARFPDPDRLNLHRPTGRHCGFGMGIHYCLGAGLARAEVEIGLTGLLQQLPHLALTDEPPRYPADLVFHGPDRLMVHPGSPRASVAASESPPT